MRKRGPHPKDLKLFNIKNHKILKDATDDFSWLLTRDYPRNSALTLVGNRYALRDRQRIAIGRCSFSNKQIENRKKTQIKNLIRKTILIDGFNILTTIESNLGEGILLKGKDGVIRDMASVHGTYRLLRDTSRAIELIGKKLEELNVSKSIWYLDQPVSNSGKLKQLLLKIAKKNKWNWEIILVPNPDEILIKLKKIILTGDSQILDNIDQWFDLPGLLINKKQILKF
jgi:hypothetical protein